MKKVCDNFLLCSFRENRIWKFEFARDEDDSFNDFIIEIIKYFLSRRITWWQFVLSFKSRISSDTLINNWNFLSVSQFTYLTLLLKSEKGWKRTHLLRRKVYMFLNLSNEFYVSDVGKLGKDKMVEPKQDFELIRGSKHPSNWKETE